MKNALITIALLGGGLVLSGCAREAGGGDRVSEFGQAARVNLARQIAYNNSDEYLIELNRVFAAETEETVTFAFNSARLDSTARRALDGQARWLKANPEVRMAIAGHTDAVGGEGYNQRLGLRRARASLNYLVRRGVERSRLDAIESFGESQLAVETEARERRNRRTVTMVAGVVRNFVGTGIDGRLAQTIFNTYRTKGVEPGGADSTDVGG